MQNQIALYLIFATGIILILGSLLNSDYILGKNVSEADLHRHRTPLLTRLILKISRKKYVDENGEEYDDYSSKRRNSRILLFFLGVVVIILGIIALNSGKFS